MIYHPEYGKALQLLPTIHSRYQKTIDIKKQDVRLAIYYLAGGCIREANFALQSWGNGDLNTPFRSKRYIDEASLLITLMILVEDRDRFVRRFFKDEIVTIDPLKYKKDIMVKMGMDEEAFNEWIKRAEVLKHGFSKGVHPTYRSVAYNTNINTGEFDYEAKSFAFYPIDGFDFANFVIIPTIDAVINPSEVFGVNRNELNEIEGLRQKIQKIAIDEFKVYKAKKVSDRDGS
jgi:hypothetical protein